MSCAALILCVPWGGGGAVAGPPIPWHARNVEHLLNRAGFGAGGDEIERGLALGLEALVGELVDGPQPGVGAPWVDVEPALFRWEDFGLDVMQVTLPDAPYFRRSTDEQVGMCKDARVVDRNQFVELYQRWFASMSDGSDPLRDRMTLFWHGYFTTSWEVVKRKYEIIRQFQWLRRGAVGSYADLLHGIVRDPAMLQFLDQTASSKEHPNENLARELLELFSLGEGNYAESDVREAARALTGNRCASDGSFEFLAAAHDAGPETILGRTGPFDDRALVDHVLAAPACPLWVSRRILRWIEGVEPSTERVARYGEILRSARFELKPFLRALFLDPDFYRADVVGSRVLSPIEYLAFACRKLGIRPNGHFLNKAGVTLGQSFYWPPSVKGWPEGLDWITNDALLRRGNVMGALLGVLESGPGARAPATVEAGAREVGTVVEGAPDLQTLIRTLDGARWIPPADLVAALEGLESRRDEDVARFLLEEWLPGPPTTGSIALVRDWIAAERAREGVGEPAWTGTAALRTSMLRRLAHLVFSLPEAHLG